MSAWVLCSLLNEAVLLEVGCAHFLSPRDGTLHDADLVCTHFLPLARLPLLSARGLPCSTAAFPFCTQLYSAVWNQGVQCCQLCSSSGLFTTHGLSWSYTNFGIFISLMGIAISAFYFDWCGYCHSMDSSKPWAREIFPLCLSQFLYQCSIDFRVQVFHFLGYVCSIPSPCCCCKQGCCMSYSESVHLQVLGHEVELVIWNLAFWHYTFFPSTSFVPSHEFLYVAIFIYHQIFTISSFFKNFY